MLNLMIQSQPSDAEVIYYLSSSYDGKNSGKFKPGKCKNPLSWESKLKYCKDTLPDFPFAEKKVPGLYQALQDLYKQGFNIVYFFAGEDRVEKFEELKKYNGNLKTTDPNFYEFDKFEIVNAGSRSGGDKESEASASLLRQCVIDDDYEKFKRFAGTKNLTEQMWDELKEELGIEELEESVRRHKKYLREMYSRVLSSQRRLRTK